MNSGSGEGVRGCAPINSNYVMRPSFIVDLSKVDYELFEE